MYIHNLPQNNTLTFSTFVLSYISLSVVAGLFTYRLINSLLDNIILPLLDISVLPESKFHKFTKVYNYKKKEIKNSMKNKEYIYVIRPGIFLKDLIIWCFIMILLYLIYRISKK